MLKRSSSVPISRWCVKNGPAAAAAEELEKESPLKRTKPLEDAQKEVTARLKAISEMPLNEFVASKDKIIAEVNDMRPLPSPSFIHKTLWWCVPNKAKLTAVSDIRGR
jgi:hypothetical protein